MGQRHSSLARQIRDNGVTYNVYADEDGPQRPWSLGLFPLILSASSWQHIEAGVSQRVRLLDNELKQILSLLRTHGLRRLHLHEEYLSSIS